MATTSSMLHLIAKVSLLKKLKNRIYMDKNLTCTAFGPKKDIYIYIYIFFQIEIKVIEPGPDRTVGP